MDDAAAQPFDETANPKDGGRVKSARAGRHIGAIALFLSVALSVLAADLILKHLVFATMAGGAATISANAIGPAAMHLPRGQTIVIPHLLGLRLTLNGGVIFGLAQGGRWVFVAVSVIAAALITRIFWHSPARAWGMHLALGLILAGALGNLYDRLVFGYVRDMLHLFPGVMLPFGLNWPGGSAGLYPWIFNLADASLVVGVIGLMLVIWRRELRPPEPQ